MVGSGGSDGEDPSREIVSPDLPPLEKEPSVDEFNLNAEQVVTAVEAYEAKLDEGGRVIIPHPILAYMENHYRGRKLHSRMTLPP